MLIILVKLHYSTAGSGGIWRRYGLFSEISLKIDLPPDFPNFLISSPKSLTPTHIFPLINFSWQPVVALIIKFPERSHIFLNTKQFLRYDETNPPLRAHFRQFVQKNFPKKSISRLKIWLGRNSPQFYLSIFLISWRVLANFRRKNSKKTKINHVFLHLKFSETWQKDQKSQIFHG